MEPKKTKKIGKGTIFFNHNASEKAPRYKARIEMDEGGVYEIPLWFNGTAGQEGFRIALKWPKGNPRRKRMTFRFNY